MTTVTSPDLPIQLDVLDTQISGEIRVVGMVWNAS